MIIWSPLIYILSIERSVKGQTEEVESVNWIITIASTWKMEGGNNSLLNTIRLTVIESTWFVCTIERLTQNVYIYTWKIKLITWGIHTSHDHYQIWLVSEDLRQSPHTLDLTNLKLYILTSYSVMWSLACYSYRGSKWPGYRCQWKHSCPTKNTTSC